MEKKNRKIRAPGGNLGVVQAIKHCRTGARLAELIGVTPYSITKARDVTCTADLALKMSNATGIPLRRFGYTCKHP